MNTIAVRYGEISLKKRNRNVFEKALVNNIKRNIKSEINIRRLNGRIYIDYKEGEDEIIEKLKNTFGIVSISKVEKCNLELEDIKRLAEKQISELIQERGRFSFKVESKRANKGFYLKSPELSMKVGGHILKTFDEHLTVDVHHPDVIVNIEVREVVYMYTNVIKGLSGMPYKTAGRGMLLLSGGIDSPVAGFQMARRGVELYGVHFHSFPFTSNRAQEKVYDLARKLVKYTGKMKVYSVNILEIQEVIRKHCPSEEITIISRRFMMAIAERLANLNNCKCLITGESIAQVASQTMEGLNVTNSRVNLPVFRPLIALDKVDIIKIAKNIDTYETSILPFEDCCTVFLPDRVVIKPEVEDIEKSEENLEVEVLIDRAIEGMEEIVIERD